MLDLRIDRLSIRAVSIPLAAPRAISREVTTHANLIEVTAEGCGLSGTGQAGPTPYWGESVEQALSDFAAIKTRLLSVKSRQALQDALPPGALRNAVDCALWDLQAKQGGRPAEAIAGLCVAPVTTAFTISLDTPEAMSALAARERGRPLIKIKLGRFEGDAERLRAVRAGAPKARLICDANQGWTLDQLTAIAPVVAEVGIELIEQPLPVEIDECLRGVPFPAPLCADEACHTRKDLPRLQGLYSYINMKLDKTGGLTEALALADEAKARGFGLMIGCTWGSTLGMAPAFLAAQHCAFADLDGPLFLAEREREHLDYDGSTITFAASCTWGR